MFVAKRLRGSPHADYNIEWKDFRSRFAERHATSRRLPDFASSGGYREDDCCGQELRRIEKYDARAAALEIGPFEASAPKAP